VNGSRGLIIATAAAFVVGCSAGLIGGILFMRFAGPPMFGVMRHRPEFIARRGPGGPERMMPMLERALDLSPEQRERVVAHLDRARRETAAVHESLQVWIERELTPEQRVRWKQMEDRFERSRHDRRSREPMPPGGP
jgi:hypothetical protein